MCVHMYVSLFKSVAGAEADQASLAAPSATTGLQQMGVPPSYTSSPHMAWAFVCKFGGSIKGYFIGYLYRLLAFRLRQQRSGYAG